MVHAVLTPVYGMYRPWVCVMYKIETGSCQWDIWAMKYRWIMCGTGSQVMYWSGHGSMNSRNWIPSSMSYYSVKFENLWCTVFILLSYKIGYRITYLYTLPVLTNWLFPLIVGNHSKSTKMQFFRRRKKLLNFFL